MKENAIEIYSPYLSYNEDGTLCRYNVDVMENGELKKLYAEVEREYSPYLCTERSDAILFLVLPVALREGYDIYCKTPVSEQFLHNLNEIFIPHLLIGDSRLHKINIYAETDNKPMGGEGVGTGVTCGVDSLYTIMNYTNGKYTQMQLTHLFITSSNLELCQPANSNLRHWECQHIPSFKRYKVASEDLNLPLVKLYSNFFWYIVNRGTQKYHHLWMYAYITIAEVLILKRLWKTYLFSSAYDFSLFSLKNNATEDPAHYELLTVHSLTTPDLQWFSCGAKASRNEKTLALTDFELARRTLHPCHWHGDKNCTNLTCGKCLRALLLLDYYDKLGTMAEVFDIERYKRERSAYLRKCIENKYSSVEIEFFGKLYNMMYEKYPNEMKAEEENYKKSMSPVPRSDFDDLVNVYDFSIKLLSLNDPAAWLKQFFKSKGVKKLYCTGRSRLGGKIISLIANEIVCVNEQNSNPKECEAAFILNSDAAGISNLSRKLRDAGAAAIYNLYDIRNEFMHQNS